MQPLQFKKGWALRQHLLRLVHDRGERAVRAKGCAEPRVLGYRLDPELWLRRGIVSIDVDAKAASKVGAE
jgi:hypothetical protein